MKSGYIRSSPHFFRLIKRCLVLVATALLLLAAWIPAPLQEEASIVRVPNPVKSAWFLLWIQEMVSYSKYLIDLLLVLALLGLLLPWLPGVGQAEKAKWLPRDQRLINAAVIGAFVAIVALTVVAMFFRGPNWAWHNPF